MNQKHSFLIATIGLFFALGVTMTAWLQMHTGDVSSGNVLPTLAVVNDSASEISDTTDANTISQNEPTFVEVENNSAQAAPPSESSSIVNLPVPEAADNVVVLRFDSTATIAEREALIASIGGTVQEEIAALNTVVVQLATTRDSINLESDLLLNSEPDHFATVLDDTSAPNDDYYDSQYALSMVNAPAAWAMLPDDAPTINVAVIDSGVCADHEDMQGRILENLAYDFVDHDSIAQDDYGHGCAVAGIIAAQAGNGVGIAGIAPNTMILPLRVLDEDGVGNYSDIASAIIYAVDNGAHIINLSLGGVYPSSLLEDAVNYAFANNVLVVAAAGNNATTVLRYPAQYENAIAVGSVNEARTISSFSNYGVDIGLYAPGEAIITLSGSTVATRSGTSFAAPHVSGVAALEMALGGSLVIDGSIVQVNIDDAPAATDTPEEPPNTPPPSDLPTAGDDFEPLSMMDTQLNELYARWLAEPSTTGYTTASGLNVGETDVRFTMADEASAEAIIDFIEASGGTVEAHYKRWIVARVAISELPRLAQYAGVYFMQPPLPVYPANNDFDSDLMEPLAGTVDTQGVVESGADQWHNNGWTGQGVKVIVFDGFKNYTDRQAAGELPPNIQLYGFVDTTLDLTQGYGHGVFCAEIIYDMAPDAELAFSSVGNDVDYAAKLTQAIDDGYDVASISLAAGFGTEAGDGAVGGPWTDAAKVAADRGMLISQSTANNGLSHWHGNYNNSGTDGWHTFDSGGNNSFNVRDSALVNRLGNLTIPDAYDDSTWTWNPYTIPVSMDSANWQWLDFYVRWNDWNNTRDGNVNGVDYNVYLMKWDTATNTWIVAPNSTDGTTTWVGKSENDQTNNNNVLPIERVGYLVDSSAEYGIAIQRINGNGTQVLDINMYPGFPHFEYNVREGSIQDAATSPFVMGVAAHSIITNGTGNQGIAAYSGFGPIKGLGGTLANPTHRQPTIAGYSEVATSIGTFGGTSAAVPHVAGAAAVIKSAFPFYDFDDIRQHMTDNAVDEGATGYDNAYGYGRLHLGTAPLSTDPIDVYMLVDMSGSFIDDIDTFQANANDLINDLTTKYSAIQFGLGSFIDYPYSSFGLAGDYAYRQHSDLTDNFNLVRQAINGLEITNPDSGNDYPESQLAALYQTTTGDGQVVAGQPAATIGAGQDADFRNDAVKIIIVYTDADYHRANDVGDDNADYPGPSFSQTVDAVWTNYPLSLDANLQATALEEAALRPKVVGISSGGGGYDDLVRLARATGSFAPEGGADCDNNGTIDVPEGAPLVCTISDDGTGISEAINGLVDAAREAVPFYDLVLTKDADRENTYLNEPITYTVKVENLGPAEAPDVQIVDNIPLDMTVVSTSPECTVDGTEVTCSLGTIDPIDEASITITVMPGGPGIKTNVAFVTSTNEDDLDNANEADPVNNTDSVDVEVFNADRYIVESCEAPDLIEAINLSNASSVDSVIELNGSCTYSLTKVNNTLYGRNGLPTILPVAQSGTLFINGFGATIERASGQFRFLVVSNGADLTFTDVTLQKAAPGGDLAVGALYNEGSLTLDTVTLQDNRARYIGGIYSTGEVTITNSVLRNNRAAEHTGAIFIESGTLNIDNTLFEDNRARWGAGIRNVAGDVTITNSWFIDNDSPEHGAAVYNESGTVNIAGTTFESNRTRFGSIVYNQSGNLTLNDSALRDTRASERGAGFYNDTGNVAIDGFLVEENRVRFGAGLYNHDGTATVANSIFRNNTGVEAGTGIYNHTGSVSVVTSTFDNNTARFGAAIFNNGGSVYVADSAMTHSRSLEEGGAFQQHSGISIIVNSTISGNWARFGGGVHIKNGEALLTNVTIANNEAQEKGGGLFIGGTVVGNNTLIATNTARQDNDVAGMFDAASSNNLIGGNPLIGSLANNGGTTQTHALLDGSPAIDAGDTPLAVDMNNAALAFDQRGEGFPRVLGSSVDIGAYESTGNAPVETPEVTPELTDEPIETPEVTDEPIETPEVTPELTDEPIETPEVTDEPSMDINPVEVCWVENHNNAESVWRITNNNSVPAVPNTQAKVLFDWATYASTDGSGSALQSGRAYDQRGEYVHSTVLANSFKVLWYVWENGELLSDITMIVITADEVDRCDDMVVEPTEEVTPIVTEEPMCTPTDIDTAEFLSIEPVPGTELVRGETYVFTAVIEYNLATRSEAILDFAVYGFNGDVGLGRRHDVAVDVQQGCGIETLEILVTRTDTENDRPVDNLRVITDLRVDEYTVLTPLTDATWTNIYPLVDGVEETPEVTPVVTDEPVETPETTEVPTEESTPEATEAPTETLVTPLDVCWVQDRNNAESVWQITNANLVPLQQGSQAKVRFDWVVYDDTDAEIQTATGWDQTGTVTINTRVASRIEITWYTWDNGVIGETTVVTASKPDNACS